jgi:Na+/proline symporter
MIEKYSVIALYFTVLLVLGLFAARGVRDMKGFVTGGKSLSFWVAAFSHRRQGSRRGCC